MADPSSHRTVYVSTNLDTHLALGVSVNDTVADLKRKILLEHPVNFSKVGEIKIHALKIKRKGVFYCLADNVFLQNTFDWVKGSRNHGYLYLDASTLSEHSKELHPVLADGGSGWLVNYSGSPLLQVEHNLCANQEPPIFERNFSGASSRDSSKDEMTRGKHVSDNHYTYDARGEGLEVRGKQTECMVDNSRGEIIDMQHILLLEGTTQDGTNAKENKKGKRKKKKDVVCDLVEKEDATFTVVPPKDTSEHDVGVADDTGVQRTNDQSKGIGVSLQEADSNIDKSENEVVIAKDNNLSGVISENSSLAKKRKRLASEARKIVDIPCNLLGDISSPAHNSPVKKSHAKKNKSNKDAYKDTTTPEYSLGENTGKKIRKSSVRRKAADADLSSLKELREDNPQGIPEDNHKDFGETEAVVTGVIVPDETITKVDATSLKGKYDDPIEQVVEKNVPCSSDVDTEDPRACDVGDVSGVEKMDASRSCNVDLKDMPSSTAQELKDLVSNTEVGVQENTNADYFKRTGVDQSDVIEEAIKLYQNDNTLDETPEPAKSSKKANKSKINKKAAREEKVPALQEIGKSEAGGGKVEGKKKRTYKKGQIDAAGSALEVEKGHDVVLKIPVVSSDMERNDVSKTGTGSISLMDNDGESEKRTEEDVPLLQEISKSQAGGGSADGKKKRATRKRQADVERSALEVQVNDQDASLTISVIATEKEMEKRIENELPLLQDIRKGQAGDGNVGGKKKRVTKKRQPNVEIRALEFQENYQGNGLKIPVGSNDMKRDDVSNLETDGISMSAIATEEEVPTLQEIRRSPADGENLGRKKKKMTKKMQTDLAINNIEIQEKDEDAGFEIPVVSNDMERNDVSKTNTDGNSAVATKEEMEQRMEENVLSLQEISKSQAVDENVDGKKIKTTKKRQTNVARSALKVQEKDQASVFTIPVVSSDTARNDSSKIKTDGNFPISTAEKVPSLQEISKSQAGNVDGKKKKATKKRQTDVVARSALEVQEKDQDAGLKVPVLSSDAKVVGISPKRDDGQKEVSNESTGIDGQDEQEVKSDDEVVDTGKLVVHSISDSPNLESSVKVIQSRGSKRKSQDGSSSAVELPRSSRKIANEPLLQSGKKALKASESKMTPAPSINSSNLESVSKQPRNPDILMASGFITPIGKHKEVYTKPNTSLQSSKARNDLQSNSVRKSSGSNLGEVVNKTENKKNLLASSAIFKDDSSRSPSLGNQAGVNSDASTRTPSHNVSSTDFSDAESNSSENEVDSPERTEDGKKLSSVPKGMKLEDVLRNSSTYKKLKLSLPEYDSDGQPIDFVPDSEANP